MGSRYAFKRPEARINSGFSGDAPSPPGGSYAQTRHEGKNKHPLSPHGVENRIAGIKNS